jgi:hypothetical protein
MTERARMPTRAARFACLLTVLFAPLGCGEQRPPLVPVQGRVVKYGKPLPNAIVWFRPLATNAQPMAGKAFVGPEGRYRAKTGDRFGLSPGKYEITVTTGADPDESKIGDVVRVEGNFAREVPPSGGDVDLDVTARPDPPSSF